MAGHRSTWTWETTASILGSEAAEIALSRGIAWPRSDGEEALCSNASTRMADCVEIRSPLAGTVG